MIANRVPRVLLVVAGLCLAPPVPARGEDATGVLAGSRGSTYVYRAWTTENGLPQESVPALAQTRDGYLWQGTFGGLARFNGVDFRAFDVAGHQELANNRTISLYADRRGGLWIGHQFAGLSRFDGRRFTSYGGRDGLPEGDVWAIVEDLEGDLWAATLGGLVRRRGGAFTTFTERHGLPARHVLSLAVNAAGGLWIGTASGLARGAGNGPEDVPIFTAVDGAPRAAIYSIVEDGDGILWLDSDQGLIRRHRGRWETVLASPRPYLRGTLGGNLGGKLVLDRQGQLWFADHPRARLYRLSARDRRAPLPVAPEFFELSRPVLTLYVDREETLWLGTQSLGLWSLERQPVRRWSTEHGLAYPEIRAITADGRGGLWLASDCELPLTRWQSGSFSAHPAAAPGGPLDCVGSILRDRRGDLWLGAGGHLARLRAGEVIERHVLVDSRERVINALFEDRRGGLWIGFRGHGLARFDRGDIRFYTHRDGLASDHVHFLAEDRDGALWIGTSDGLSRFAGERPAGGGLKQTFETFTRDHGLPPGMVRAIHPDGDGTLWIGTYGGGLGRLRRRVAAQGGRGEVELSRITMDDGLYDNVITRILEDERGNLWMLGNRGLFFVHRDALNALADGERESVFSVSFGRAEGMTEGSGARQPAGWRTGDGKMWLPTVDGLAMIDAGSFRANPVAPKVMIELAMTGRRQLDLEPPAPAVVLEAGERDLEIHYAASSFAAPEKVRFRHRLEGYDDDWLEVGGRRAAYYTNLSPGSYVFRVTAANHHGVWNPEGAAVRIELPPPFWATPMFRAAVLVVLAGLLWTAHRLQLRVQARRAELEHAATRERFIAELQAKNTELERFSYTVAHDLKSPLVTIQGFLGFLERDVTRGDAERVTGDAQRIRGAANKMQRLIDDLLELSRIGRKDNPPEEVAMEELAGEVVELLAGQVAERGAEVAVAPDLPVVRGDRVRLYQLLQNLIQNALQHTGEQTAPRIEVGARPAAGAPATLFVRDNGAGIAPAYHDKIFELFQRLGTAGGSGVGLTLVQRIVELHGGRIWVESEGAGKGSTFCFTLPRAPAPNGLDPSAD